jgi:YidC/Oxa1 family membrane protein insertase
MFTNIIVQPIFNLLVLIYALLPGHNFGLALIIFTVVVRVVMWPLVRRQLHQAKAMRKLQPEIKKLKQKANGDRQMESSLMMELYKERGINPFSTFPILFVQVIILFGLYSGLRRVINNSHQIISFAYPGLQHLAWLVTLSHNIHRFDNTLFGFVNLSRPALGAKGLYWPAMVIVFGSAVAQYYQSKQLLPDDSERRSIKAILSEANQGKQADQSEITAAVGHNMRFLLPVFIFGITVHLASALSLYWLVGGVVAYIQQYIVLKEDESEMESEVNTKPTKNVAKIPEAEIVVKNAKPKTASKKAKRRRRS